MRWWFIVALTACSGPEGVLKESATPADVDGDGISATAGDCDDSDPEVSPGNPELCDGRDNDCDDQVDEGATEAFYRDNDDDGFGQSDDRQERCEAPEGYVAVSGDCDDSRIDVYPGATEVCDGVDQDCDAGIDEELSATWYLDADGDGWGTESAWITDCIEPIGYVSNRADCDDDHAEINPDAGEVCNGVDDDCDGVIDPDGAPGGESFYADSDGDGYGDGVALEACEAPPGHVDNADDCDDSNPDIYPGAVEWCNGLDDDCDGAIDAGALDATTWYADRDGDLFGDIRIVVASCAAPAGFVANPADCDDTSSDVSPVATELCDGVDNDCDGVVDEADAADAEIWYADNDADTFGDPASTVRACEAPAGYVADNADCDDTSTAVHPDAVELCNGIDDDCDGIIDGGSADPGLWYLDLDGDSFGDPASAVSACDAPPGYIADNADCDDTSSSVYPGAPELCNGIDDNCDGVVDEGGDSDGDGVLDCNELTYSVEWGIAVDDEWSAWIDGAALASNGGWSTAYWYSFNLDSGPHSLTIYGWDTGAAIAGLLTYVTVNGAYYSSSGDGLWKVYDGVPSGSYADPSYDTSSWGTGLNCTSSQVSNWWGGEPSSLRSLGASWIWGRDCNALGSAVVRLDFDLP